MPERVRGAIGMTFEDEIAIDFLDIHQTVKATSNGSPPVLFCGGL